ncbi:fluoride efflux transporter FluC [Nocardiopsis sp. NPDC101807]|uniref:fluoride efflux transporter FluC n=1 Tax=Nocardiopsis sp. NPDC101807 TaxID=3364339 RepID=UPI00381E9FA3
MTRPAPTLPELWPVLAVISLGGALGALARYGLDTAWPPTASGVSWTVLAINVSGSALIGVLMELLNHRWPDSRFIRVFWGVGVLGGYTTFSAYALDVLTALEHGRPEAALAYLVLTPAGALAGVWAASAVSHRALASGRRGA